MSAIDPLFAELTALEAERSKAVGGLRGDDARCASEWCGDIEDEIECANSVIGADLENPDDVYRAAMVRAAMFALAAVRCIDRAHKA